LSYYTPLKSTAQFKQLYNAGQKMVFPEFVAYWGSIVNKSSDVATSDAQLNPSPLLRCGFVASRKVGNAVKRNRCKRRLRAAFYPYFIKMPVNSLSVIFVARHSLLTCAFTKIDEAMQKVINRIQNNMSV